MLETAQSIQGMSPGSTLEYRVALSLTKFHWQFLYQYPIFGGRQVRGGQVVDFMVITTPLMTPLFVQGSYWHNSTRAKQDDWNLLVLNSYFRGIYAEAVQVYEDQLQTQEDSDEIILELFGRSNA